MLKLTYRADSLLYRFHLVRNPQNSVQFRLRCYCWNDLQLLVSEISNITF